MLREHITSVFKLIRLFIYDALSLSPGGVLKLSTLDTTATVRLNRVGLQVLGAMCKAIVGDPTTKELRLASHAECLPVESWPPVAVKRARKTVTVRVRR